MRSGTRYKGSESLLALLSTMVVAAPAWAQEVLGRISRHGVTLTVSLEHGEEDGRATLVGRFAPEEARPPLYLHGRVLAEEEEQTVPTHLGIALGQSLEALGPPQEEPAQYLVEGRSLYPPGPVVLRLPVRLPEGLPDERVAVELAVSWCACNEEVCRPPVTTSLVVQVPTRPRAQDPTSANLPEPVATYPPPDSPSDPPPDSPSDPAPGSLSDHAPPTSASPPMAPVAAEPPQRPLVQPLPALTWPRVLGALALPLILALLTWARARGSALRPKRCTGGPQLH